MLAKPIPTQLLFRDDEDVEGIVDVWPRSSHTSAGVSNAVKRLASHRSDRFLLQQ
jgi:hypothetical protein